MEVIKRGSSNYPSEPLMWKVMGRGLRYFSQSVDALLLLLGFIYSKGSRHFYGIKIDGRHATLGWEKEYLSMIKEQFEVYSEEFRTLMCISSKRIVLEVK